MNINQSMYPYHKGRRDAYGATSWILSGEAFDLPREAVERARNDWNHHYAGPILDSEEYILDYAQGFIDWCIEHSGTWGAKVEGWQGEGLYLVTWSDGGMAWTNNGPEWMEDEAELALCLATAWLHATDTHVPCCEYMGDEDGEE